MRKLAALILIICLSSIAIADTNIHIIGEIILKKNKRLYVDKGRSEGVEIGHTLEILYNGKKFGQSVISWVGEDISCARVDSSTFYRFIYIDPLEAKIILEKPLKYEGGTLHVPFYRSLNLNPRDISTPDEKTVARLLYDGLVRLDSQGSIVPGLAHSWELHGNTYTFYLNADVKFHSGKPLDAMDVAYSLVQLAKAPRVTLSSSFILEIDGYEEVHHGKRNELRGIFIPNKHTIAITTKDTFPPLLHYLSGPGGYIIPKVQSPQSLPVAIGTGTFEIASHSDDVIVLQKYNSVFEKAAVLDSIIFYRYKNRSEAALDFELGKLDIFYFDSENAADLLTNGSYTTRRYYTSSTVYLGFNCNHDYQKDFKLSKALQFLFDRESMVRVLLNNSAQKSDGLIPPTLNLEPAYSSDYYFSPSEAKLKIAQIDGLPDRLNLVYDSLDPVLESIADYITGQLRQAGIKIKVANIGFRKTSEQINLSSLDMFLFRYDLPVPDLDAFFYPLFTRRLSGQTNLFNYDNSQLERFLESARRIDDSFTRDDIYEEAVELIIQEPPLITLYNPIMTVAFRRDIAGFEPNSGAFIDLRQTYFQAGK